MVFLKPFSEPRAFITHLLRPPSPSRSDAALKVGYFADIVLIDHLKLGVVRHAELRHNSNSSAWDAERPTTLMNSRVHRRSELPSPYHSSKAKLTHSSLISTETKLSKKI